MVTTTPNGFNLDDSGQRIVVDPVTRIEGHLRVEVNVDENNVIRNAVSTGTMWRGLEVILKGRDPRDAWAFTQRICGVCTGTHALTSVRAVEDALDITIPENANSIRNIMQLALQCHDHIVHFYHLHALDWVDVVSSLSADPKATSELAQSISSWPLSSPGYYRDLQNKLKKFVESGQLGIFANAYWGNAAYKLPPEANLMAVAHYLEALDFQKEIKKVHAIFGGKNPHPNWLVGGVPCPINIDGVGAAGGAISIERLELVKKVIQQTIEFTQKVYIPDVLAIASFYKDWTHGGGLSSQAVLSYGDIPEHANDYTDDSLLLPRGAIVGGDLANVQPVDLRDPEEIQEQVVHSWYKYTDETIGLHPWDGVSEANYELGPNAVGTKTNIEAVDEAAKYSWIKSPRWRGNAMEVGPLSRYIIGYAKGEPEFREPTEAALRHLDLPVEALFTTLGRTAARALECDWAAQKMMYFFDKLVTNIRNGDTATANVEKWDPESWPTSAKGVGFTEAPRGALGHWVRIENGKIENYQCVVPTTWNAGPRDNAGNIGAFEAALMNTPVVDPNQPVEILRTLHSFDPCMACSTHLMSPDGEELAEIKVR